MESAYRRLTDAIAEEMFSSASAGLPVYCLADEEVRKRILKTAGIASDGGDAISGVVRSTLNLADSGTPMLDWHVAGARRHAAQPLETPPALPLLLVLAQAAERMHADRDHASHNYYARLHELLDIPTGDHARATRAYQKHANELWGSLNAWLEAWEGERGIPTAYAIGGHDYVGLPMSQAVVRQHDREGLREFFALEGFAPGQRVAPSDMEAAMEPYATKTPSPFSAHLASLWHNPAARDRIVDAACLELDAWDGSGAALAEAGRHAGHTHLLAFVRTFPRKKVEFNLAIPYRSDSPSIVRFHAADGTTEVPTVAGPGGSTRLSTVQLIEASSLIADRIEGTFGIDNDRQVRREPRRVVPLRWDDLQGSFVEVECAALGDEVLLIARHDTRSRLEAHLREHARPGWSELADLPGLPDSWIAYERVQVVSVPTATTHFDLLPLAPRARTSLTVSGGFRLPGLLRKWSSLEPPEIVAVAANAKSVDLRVYDGTRVDPGLQLVSTSTDGEVAVLPLAGEELADGEYLVGMFVDGATRPASTALIRLRSASTPQFSVAEDDIRLVYSPESSPRWPLSAGPADWPAHVSGARTLGLPEVLDSPREAMPEFTPRAARPKPQSPPRLSVGVPVAEDSCLVTGKHRTQLPPAPLPGERRTRTIVGECSTCGTVRRSAGTAWAARRRDTHAAKPRAPLEIPRVVDAPTHDLRTATDALNHVGHGTLSTLETIAAQVEGSGLLSDVLVRRLEAVGHIDIARDDRLKPTHWAVNSATLVPVDGGKHVLTGAHSAALVAQLRRSLEPDATVTVTTDGGIPRIEVCGSLVAKELAEMGIVVLHSSPAASMANALPTLSSVAESLTRIAVPKYRSAEYWDCASASWIAAGSLAMAGAYRLRDFGSIYVVRSMRDLENGTLALANAQLVKHVANLWANDPLVGYHSRTQSVVTPLGADLPGLYGRALTLCSGRAPIEIEKSRLLQYPGVSREVADIVFSRISQ
ncbi:hypothetical protein [Demequina silvatica]|uniref:hypothetical protein n=1 Tax=Demequina silvatica TaxID=1638988 RepID=UPI000781775D|nr:hypothetical protein [Demequina silvatica]